MPTALAVLASGMMTGVGLTSAATCAAIRCALSNFQETGFYERGGKPVVGSPVPLPRPWRGLAKHVQLVVPPIRECLSGLSEATPPQIPLLLCVAEPQRPGRVDGLDDELPGRVQRELGYRLHHASRVLAAGRIGGALALPLAQELIEQARVPAVLVAGVDSYLIRETLRAYEVRERLMTSQNSNGFIPGEAGACVLLARADSARAPRLVCRGYGAAEEQTTVESGEPLLGRGLATAVQEALRESGFSMVDMGFRITDTTGEQYYFKEAELAVLRTLRQHKEEFDIWHPADCIGEVGAAIGPCALGIALAAVRKAYAPAPRLLCHFGSDDGRRAAFVLSHE